MLFKAKHFLLKKKSWQGVCILLAPTPGCGTLPCDEDFIFPFQVTETLRAAVCTCLLVAASSLLFQVPLSLTCRLGSAPAKAPISLVTAKLPCTVSPRALWSLCIDPLGHKVSHRIGGMRMCWCLVAAP